MSHDSKIWNKHSRMKRNRAVDLNQIVTDMLPSSADFEITKVINWIYNSSEIPEDVSR